MAGLGTMAGDAPARSERDETTTSDAVRTMELEVGRGAAAYSGSPDADGLLEEAASRQERSAAIWTAYAHTLSEVAGEATAPPYPPAGGYVPDRQGWHDLAGGDGDPQLQAPEELDGGLRRRDPVYGLPRSDAVLRLLDTFSDWDVGTMMRIVACESGFDENAVSPPDYDGLANYGLTQLHGDPEGLDPAYNIDQAHEKWLAGGYGPWRGSQGCWG